MKVIDKTYFQYGDMQIGQFGSQEVQDKLTWYIDNYEPEILRLLLGNTVYNDLIASIDAATSPTDIPEPYYSLLYGADFLAPEGWGSAHQMHWDGLRSQKDSLVAKYVYFYYLRSEATFLTGNGVTVPKLENATRVASNPLQRARWNEMVDQNKTLFAYMRSNMDLFPDWPYQSYGWGWPERWRGGYRSSLYGNYCALHNMTALQSLFIPINDLNL